jgi:hypothetical protein
MDESPPETPCPPADLESEQLMLKVQSQVREVVLSEQDVGRGYLDSNKAWQVVWIVNSASWWRFRSILVARADDGRFTKSAEGDCRYYARPLVQTLVCGSLAVLLLAGQFAVPGLDLALGSPLGESTGLLRLLMMFAGAACAFGAWPAYGSSEMTDKEADRLISMHEDFQRAIRDKD